MSLLRAGCQPSPVWLREQNLGKTQLQAGHPAHLFLSFRRIRLSATADGFAGNWKILTGCFPGARRVASCHSPCPGLDYSGPSGQILEAWPSGPRTFWDSPVIYPRVKNLWVKLSIRGGEFKSLGFQGPEQLQRKKLLRPPLGTGIGIGNVIGIEFVIQFKALWLSHIVDADAESDPP